MRIIKISVNGDAGVDSDHCIMTSPAGLVGNTAIGKFLGGLLNH